MDELKAAVLRRPGELSVEEMPEPACPPGGAVVEVAACAICPTDIKMTRVGQRDLSYPRILGHEVVGRIERIDGDAGPFAVGDLVQVWPGIACGRCPSCLQGRDNLCDRQGIIGFNRDGGFAERMAVPAETIARGGLNRVPEDVDPALATLTEPLACCVHGQRSALVSSRDRIVIFGGGPMGLMHAALASHLGAAALVIEPDEGRRELAVKMGAEEAVDPRAEGLRTAIEHFTKGRGADVAILATPQVRVDDPLLRSMAPGGRICVFSGLPKSDPVVQMDLNALHYRELMLVGAYGCTSGSNAEAARLIVEGLVDVSPLVTRKLPLSAIEQGFRMIEERQALKCVITELSR